MKIYQVGKEGLKIPDETKVSSRKSRETDGKSGPARKDRVFLSQDVQRLIEIEKQRGEAVEAREELVENIKGKLQKGTYNVTQVAYHLGFNDAFHFSRSFKQRFGIAPSEVQAQQRKSTRTIFLSDELAN